MLELTEEVIKDLKEVNSRVNRLPYKSDIDLYQLEDFWTRIGNLGGDCEDFALEKRHRLLEKGFPLESLKLAICMTKEGGHAVLMIDTDKGTYVLDNNTDIIYPWSDPPYPIEWISRQSGKNWVKI